MTAPDEYGTRRLASELLARTRGGSGMRLGTVDSIPDATPPVLMVTMSESSTPVAMRALSRSGPYRSGDVVVYAEHPTTPFVIGHLEEETHGVMESWHPGENTPAIAAADTHQFRGVVWAGLSPTNDIEIVLRDNDPSPPQYWDLSTDSWTSTYTRFAPQQTKHETNARDPFRHWWFDFSPGIGFTTSQMYVSIWATPEDGPSRTSLNTVYCSIV